MKRVIVTIAIALAMGIAIGALIFGASNDADNTSTFAQTERNTNNTKDMKTIVPADLTGNPINTLSKDWMLISAGNKEKYNTMTASWGGFGFLWNKPVAYIFVRPERYTYQFVETSDNFTLTFFDEAYRSALQLLGSKSGRDGDKVSEAGLTPIFTALGNPAFVEAHTIIECKKLYGMQLLREDFMEQELANSIYGPADSLHKLFIGEIIDVKTRR